MNHESNPDFKDFAIGQTVLFKDLGVNTVAERAESTMVSGHYFIKGADGKAYSVIKTPEGFKLQGYPIIIADDKKVKVVGFL